ncbi:MAG: FecR family protein [Hyphomicrobiales bacterium]
MILGPKVWIRTGIRGRAMLRRDKETILYRPNTQARLVQNNRSSRMTELYQTTGRLLVDVETRKYKHTTVMTPYLSVAVKGTRFQVFVGSGKSTVTVERGLVEVTDTRRSERVDVSRGQNVTLAQRGNQRLMLRGRGKKAPIINARTGKPIEIVGNQITGGNGVGSNGPVNQAATGSGGGLGGNGGGLGGNGGGGSVSGSVSEATSSVSGAASSVTQSVSDTVNSLLP